MARDRFRDIGGTMGDLPPGPHNAITDIGEVRVGHITLREDPGGERGVCTGVTAILAHGGNLFRQKVRAGPM